MKKRILHWTLMVALTLSIAGPQVMAEEMGKKDKTGTLSGCEKGKKEGWEANAPSAQKKAAVEAISEKAATGEEAAEEAGEQKKETQKESEKEKE